MKVLGIDPGTRVLGYAVLENGKNGLIPHVYGAICTKNKDSLARRLQTIYRSLVEVIDLHRPQVTAIEKVFFGKNIQSALRIGEARGVAFLAAANAGMEVYEYDPTKIKKSVVGTGRAHKSQIQFMLKNILNLSKIPTPEDAADALAIAFCHCQQLVIDESK